MKDINEPLTFAEIEGKDVFNWWEFLNKVSFTYQELYDAKELAQNWVTCACGNQCSIIPRAANDTEKDYKGQPLDYILKVLGVDFFKAIKDMYYSVIPSDILEYNRNHAILILLQIEERSFELIVEELDKLQNNDTKTQLSNT